MGKQRPFFKIEIYDDDPIALKKFVDDQKNLLFNEAFVGIKSAMRKNSTEAIICYINDINIRATLPKEDWNNALSSSLGYFESNDEYEKCLEINSLLKQLQHEPRSGSYRYSETTTQ